jgi:predicted negative regulator of RcsB-dependent stress response
MNKTTRTILIALGIGVLATGMYFGYRYYQKSTKAAKAKKALKELETSKVPVYTESKVAVKSVWKPKKPTISVMSSFSSASGSYFAENKAKYNSFSKDPLIVGLEFYNMYKK